MKVSQNTRFYLAAIASLVTALVYSATLHNDFVDWDDNEYIYDNVHIRSIGVPFLRWAFTGFHVANWHPFTWVSHALDYAIWGLNPLGHHLTSIVLHSINTFLVIILAVKLLEMWKENLTKNQGFTSLDERGVLIAASVTGLLFGLHPLHVESVAWVSERKDLLCALFFLLSIIAYVNHAEKENVETSGYRLINKQYLLSLIYFLFALLSKPMAVSLPFVLLILDWCVFQNAQSLKTFRKSFVSKIPFFILSLLSSIITILAQHSDSAIKTAPLLTRLLVAAKAVVAYLGKMILPGHLVPYYPYPLHVSLFMPEFWIPIVIIIGITIAGILTARKQRLWLSAWGYYVVTLLPVAGIVKVGDQAMADRYTYLPSLAPFFLMGMAVVWGERAARERGLLMWLFSGAIAVVVLVSMPYLTLKQIGVWENGYTLWSYVIEKEPQQGVLPYINLAVACQKKGLWRESIENLNKALERDPVDYIAFKYRGVAYEKMGLFNLAINDYTQAIAVNSSDPDAYLTRGMFYHRIGQFNKAIEDYNQAIYLNQNYDDAYFSRGNAYEKLGLLRNAIDDYSKVIELAPSSYKAYVNVGILYFKLNAFDRAIDYLSKATLVNPDLSPAYLNRGLIYWKTGSISLATADLQKACNLGGSDACNALQELSMTSSGK